MDPKVTFRQDVGGIMDNGSFDTFGVMLQIFDRSRLDRIKLAPATKPVPEPVKFSDGVA